MLQPILNKAEKKLIRKIALLQLESIKSIIRGESGEDLKMYCIINEVDQIEMLLMCERNARIFEDLIQNPENFLQLDEGNKSITKHLLFNKFNNPRYDEAKTKIWTKFTLSEQFIYRLN